MSYYAGVDTTAKGFEIEFTGHVTDQWTVSGGYTGLQVRDQNGDDTRTYLPTKSLKLATTYLVPELRDLKFGAQFRWQNAISIQDAGVVDYGVVTDPVTVRQKEYAGLDLMASIMVVDRVRASVNVRNVTD